MNRLEARTMIRHYPWLTVGTIMLAVLVASTAGAQQPVQPQSPPAARRDGDRTMTMYIGTIPGGQNKSKGIYMARFEPATGRLSNVELAAETPRPSFVAFHPSGKF